MGDQVAPRNRLARLLGESLAAASLGFFLLLIVFPLGTLVSYAAGKGWSVFLSRLAAPEAQHALLLTVEVAAVTTAVNTLAGLGLGLLLVRGRFPGRRAVDALVDIPLAIPTVVTGFALLMLYGPLGLAGSILSARGIQLMFSFPGIVLGHLFVTFPFAIRSIMVVLESLDLNLENAARTLGARESQVFWHVTLPGVREGVFAGAVLTFARSLGEFGASIMVSGNLLGRTQTAPLYIYSRFNTGDVEGAAAIAAVLAVASFLILLLLKQTVHHTQGVENL